LPGPGSFERERERSLPSYQRQRMRSLLCSCVDLPRKSPKGPPFIKSGALLLASRLTLLRQSSSGQEEAEPNSAFTVLVRVSDLSEIKRGAVRRILREPLIGKTLGLSDWPKHYHIKLCKSRSTSLRDQPAMVSSQARSSSALAFSSHPPHSRQPGLKCHPRTLYFRGHG
jgi:hypothetical protein